MEKEKEEKNSTDFCTIYAANIVSGRSLEAMDRHAKDPQFQSNWDTYIVLRMLSQCDKTGMVAKLTASVEKLKDSPELQYKLLFKAFGDIGPVRRMISNGRPLFNK